MLLKKLKKIHPAVWLTVGFVVVVFLIFHFFFIKAYDWILAEERDYALMDYLHDIGGTAQAYKKMNGVYPKDLAEISKPAEYCVYTFHIKKCTEIYYKTSANRQDFKMAADTYPMSGAWPVLFYSPDYSVSRAGLSSDSEEFKSKSTRDICWFCAAYKNSAAKDSANSFPVYKQNPKYFPNPEEWPDIP